MRIPRAPEGKIGFESENQVRQSSFHMRATRDDFRIAPSEHGQELVFPESSELISLVCQMKAATFTTLHA
ncbi:hypothetical protein [Burkholderia stabilis]|uniref:hypothetical protein n=1 Tax=Burkholderia stabilis TaxID=95485 RepID=UPI0012E9A29F|nr:hypothetical protein [Burkholderia stabilis]HDR9491673.1 hypothetical protein [Burkholderia stabilis]HDR9522294.1 hypothetical protein [Burkholderia stabilis]HDR9529543.1 hypothetical protein [Burkholderia stabilis]HDR9539124.1 hypothetical protein [Burkholderia stabilis]HDR9547239.1 hypothetical protein [Burkholderia stabilis]